MPELFDLFYILLAIGALSYYIYPEETQDFLEYIKDHIGDKTREKDELKKEIGEFKDKVNQHIIASGNTQTREIAKVLKRQGDVEDNITKGIHEIKDEAEKMRKKTDDRLDVLNTIYANNKITTNRLFLFIIVLLTFISGHQVFGSVTLIGMAGAKDFLKSFNPFGNETRTSEPGPQVKTYSTPVNNFVEPTGEPSVAPTSNPTGIPSLKGEPPNASPITQYQNAPSSYSTNPPTRGTSVLRFPEAPTSVHLKTESKNKTTPSPAPLVAKGLHIPSITPIAKPSKSPTKAPDTVYIGNLLAPSGRATDHLSTKNSTATPHNTFSSILGNTEYVDLTNNTHGYNFSETMNPTNTSTHPITMENYNSPSLAPTPEPTHPPYEQPTPN